MTKDAAWLMDFVVRDPCLGAWLFGAGNDHIATLAARGPGPWSGASYGWVLPPNPYV